MENNLFNPMEREELMSRLLGIAKAHYDRLGEEASQLGLTLPQARVLYFVKMDPMVRKLAKRLSCDASYITGIVDTLEKKGLLTRQVDPEDRRVKKLVLTPEGHRVRAKVVQAMSESFDLDGLIPDEAAQFAHLLRKIQSNEKVPVW